MNDRTCIERAEEIIRSIGAAELGRAGILRDKREYDFIVQYPPPLTFRPITEEKICD